MAGWDNPHGTLSADERRRAEMLAEIQAQANVKAFMKAEQDRKRKEIRAARTAVAAGQLIDLLFGRK